MTYQVLARKWRPATFNDLVGQEHVLKALVHGLDNDRLHQAFLFTGTRGVGKTTIGRILARCLSCEQGVSSRPCGECDSCREIFEGRFVDLIEIDAASQTKVEDMRELLDNVQYSPTRGRYRIYLIDEVHMLSAHSFNALLKTLEEPPDHVKFLLATTDPQKLPVTILSRCLQFNLKRLSAERITGHLAKVLDEEGVHYEMNALWLLARAADGSMRDALSLTDQAIAYTGADLGGTSVSQMLGTIDRADVFRLLEALVASGGQTLLAETERIAEFAPDYGAILADLLDVFHRIAMEQAVPESTDNAQGDRDFIRDIAARLSPEDAQLFYQTALIARRDLEVTPDARMGFEMALLRMLAFRPGTGGTPPDGGTEAKVPQRELEEEAPRAEQVSVPPGVAEEPPAPGDEALDPITESEADTASEPHQDDVAPQQSQPGEVEEDPPSDAEAPAEPEEAVSAAAATDEAAFDWCRDFAQLGLQGMPATLAANASCAAEEGGWILTLESGHFQLMHKRHEDRIRGAIQAVMGASFPVTFREGNPGAQTPVAYQEQQTAARRESAVTAIRGDPVVQQIVDRFEGQVIEDSIQPLDPSGMGAGASREVMR
ncbi:DNA polymerase-3 subunit gamma/tau [Halospina denitrificans]|uniref:DNA polymerase III subunit gamma/tau n=1 Tax=Halospina denitrificans TaxID=332522 RepID=A0A4R7JU54_9GAMM|nr:DNA polymerase III subunit gamma/tau [Halospina denitrificans]TDT41585.1 DNA polymerase-3 subunit gamma/tau [Halospina denitrificans]